MDGMFYRRESDECFETAKPTPGVARLLLLTVVVAIAIVGGMLLLSRAGVNLTMPEEFPAMAPAAG